jgi:flagellar basal body-associated protein FliL
LTEVVLSNLSKNVIKQEKNPMKKHLLIAISSLIVLITLGTLAWYLISPLFINKTVDEAFTFEIPSQEAVAQMSETEIQKMEAEFVAAIPSEVELDQMSEANRQAVATRVMEAALAMPAHEMDELMPTEIQAAETETEVAEAQSAEERTVEAQATEEETTEVQPTEAEVTEDQAPEPQFIQPVVVLQGQFKDADSFHKGSGTGTIYQLPDGSHLLRLEDFTVTNGPDLHVLLASSPSPTGRADLGDYVDLGSLKGNIGNQNYEIPAGTDLSQFKSVVIYCKPFHVVFSTAALG